MRTLILITVSLVLGLFTTKAQTTESLSKSSSSFALSYDSDAENKKFYRSFVTLDMDNDYRIKVRFMKHMKSDVKSYLIDQFGKENMTLKDNVYLWSKEVDGDEMYEVRLKGNKLRINLHKDLASDKLIKKFVEIGKELKSITSNTEKS